MLWNALLDSIKATQNTKQFKAAFTLMACFCVDAFACANTLLVSFSLSD